MRINTCWSGQLLALALAFLVPCTAYASCSLTEATMVTPRNGTHIVIGPNADTMPLAFVVQPDCISSTTSATFTLDGEALGDTVSGHPFGTYFSTIGELELGAHTISALCAPLTTEVDADFSLVEADADVDADLNGIPDNPFTTLVGDGYQWLARGINVTSGLDRSIAVVRWTGSGETDDAYAPITVSLVIPDAPTYKVTVSMPQALLESGEQAVMIVAIADSPQKLMGATQAATIAGIPLGHESGTIYLAFDIIISMDGGLTFRTMSASRIAATPVHLALEGINVATGENVGIYRYNGGLDGSIKSPLDFVADGSSWSSSKVSNKATRAATSTVTSLVEADVKAQGIYSAFLSTSVEDTDDDSGDGTVTPGQVTGILAGLLVLLAGLMGGQIQDFQNAGGSPCFIATAAFGTPMAHAIDSLRIFRDVFLLDNAFGTAFVDMYYRISPAVADVVAQSPALAFVVRMVLWPVIWAVRVVMTVPVFAGLVSATLIGLSLLKRRKKHSKV